MSIQNTPAPPPLPTTTTTTALVTQPHTQAQVRVVVAPFLRHCCFFFCPRALAPLPRAARTEGGEVTECNSSTHAFINGTNHVELVSKSQTNGQSDNLYMLLTFAT